MTSGYYRFPTVCEDSIVFVSEDDLWHVSVNGGIARRLTSNLGAVTYPMLSPNGELLAFVGREEGTPEIYVMPATGGSAQRLTYLSSDCRVLGWNQAGTHIIFSSTHGLFNNRERLLYQIAADCLNGEVTPLPYGPAHSISFGAEGQTVLGRNTNDPARWKRYRGGTAGHLWICREPNGAEAGATFERFLTDIEGNIASPMWITRKSGDGVESRVFFVCDHEGIGNLYSCLADGKDVQRHTDHADYYVRNPSTDGKLIVYHNGSDIYLYDVETDSTRLVTIDYRSPRVQRNRKFAYAGQYVDDERLHPSGYAMTLTSRGKLFSFYNHEGPVIQHGSRDGVRYRLPDWLNDGQRMLVVSDELGEEALEIHQLKRAINGYKANGTQKRGDDGPEIGDTEPERFSDLDIGRVVDIKISPAQDLAAINNHRQELLIVDLEKRSVTVVDHSPYTGISGFDWSPDGRWLAYGYGVTYKTTEIRLYRLPDPDSEDEALHEGSIHTVTRPLLHDVEPAFDPKGRYLYFLSYREFNPVYDGLHFDLGFPWGMRPYLVTLQADLPSPFIPRPDFEESDDEHGPTEDEEDEEACEDEDEDEAELEGEDEIEEEMDDDDEEDDDEDEELDEDGVFRGMMTGKMGRKGRRFGANGDAPPAEGDTALDDTSDSGDVDGSEDIDVKADDAKSDDAKPRNELPRLQIDLEHIERRVLAFPVPEGRYGQILGLPDKALFSVFPVRGGLDHDIGDGSDGGVLRAYNFKEYKSENLANNISWFSLSRNRKKLLYGSGHRLRVIRAGEKVPPENGTPRQSGWISLDRVKVSVNPHSEWEQMYREAWRLQRDHFWTADMSQVAWETVYHRYFPLITRVSTRGEFSDLMWEMQGELGTSHAYEYGGDYNYPPYYSQGFLGADMTWDPEAGGYRVGELILGDAWSDEATSPLAAPGIDIKCGDLLIAINGQLLDEQVSPAQLLVNQAGYEVLLTFAPRPEEANDEADDDKTGDETVEETSSESSDVSVPEAKESAVDGDDAETPPVDEADDLRMFSVKTIRSQTPAQYRAWVEGNRKQIHEASDGRVGYVHIPDMGVEGYAEFHRGYLAEVDRDALIVDVRYNGGGHVSQLILEKLARRRLGYDLSRWGGLQPYPSDSVAGPIVALTNEHAGSDGDIFCHCFKLMKLGPLIGKRTWGGVIGISPSHPLVDGTMTTQPEYSFWFMDVGWGVENYGTDPDIEVDIAPHDYVAGRDPQLESGIEVILRLLAETPIVKPDLSQRPNLALPKLPSRQ